MILLLLGGLGSLLYGGLFHAVTVEEEKERQISIPVPGLPVPGDLASNPLFCRPEVPPGMKLEKGHREVCRVEPRAGMGDQPRSDLRRRGAIGQRVS